MTRSDRRTFLGSAAALSLAPVLGRPQVRALDGLVGITTGGLNHQRKAGTLTMASLPRFMRDELGMKLIDLNTRWLTGFDERTIAGTREAVEKAGCFITNLKVNHSFGDLYAKAADDRKKAMTEARDLIVTAKRLGARWIRITAPEKAAGEPTAHRALAEFAGEQGIALVVENLGWMKSDPSSVANLVKAIGKNAVAGPDTGNWDDDVRYDALARSFPGAGTCDFKVFELEGDGRHEKYDIRRCFEIGWKAGFRGPWAIEHWNADTKAFARETVHLRDLLHRWMKERR